MGCGPDGFSAEGLGCWGCGLGGKIGVDGPGRCEETGWFCTGVVGFTPVLTGVVVNGVTGLVVSSASSVMTSSDSFAPNACKSQSTLLQPLLFIASLIPVRNVPVTVLLQKMYFSLIFLTMPLPSRSPLTEVALASSSSDFPAGFGVTSKTCFCVPTMSVKLNGLSLTLVRAVLST